MIFRGSTPRSLTLGGILLVTAALLALFPWRPIGAQPAEKERPEEKRPERKETKDFERKNRPEIEPEKAERIRKQMKEVHEEMEQARKEFEKHMRDLQQRMMKIFKEEGVEPPQGFPGQPGFRGPGGEGGPREAEHRLQNLERKVDTLLWEISNMRREMHRGPGGNPPPPPPPPPGGRRPQPPQPKE